MELPYLELALGFMILKYVANTYFNIRQHRVLKLATLPQSLQGIVTQERFKRYRSYSLDKSNLTFVREAVTMLMDTTALYFGLLPWFWMKAGELVTHIRLSPENETAHTFTFLAAVIICVQIRNLPFSLYSTAVIAGRHGVANQTILLLTRDVIKTIVGPPAVAAVIIFVQIGGPYLAICIWLFVTIMTIVRLLVSRMDIAPYFCTYTPLHKEGLQRKIEKLTASVNFPLKRLIVVHAPIGSSYGAYLYSFFDKNGIVLYKTLIQKCSDEEILAVVALELGHWKLNHPRYLFIAMEIYALLQFGWYAAVSNSKDLFQSFGFETQPIIIGFIIFRHIIPLHQLVVFGLNLINRANEFQADAFAMKLGYSSSLRAAILKLVDVKSSAMIIDPWYSAWQFFDPAPVERLSALGSFDSKEGKEGKSRKKERMKKKKVTVERMIKMLIT